MDGLEILSSSKFLLFNRVIWVTEKYRIEGILVYCKKINDLGFDVKPRILASLPKLAKLCFFKNNNNDWKVYHKNASYLCSIKFHFD